MNTWARRHARHVGTRALEHARHVGTWTRKHARHLGTWARKARNLAHSYFSWYIVKYILLLSRIIYLCKLKHICRFVGYTSMSIFKVYFHSFHFPTKILQVFPKISYHLLACYILLPSKNSPIICWTTYMSRCPLHILQWRYV